MSSCILQIALDTPLDSVFDYRWPCAPGSEPEVGQLALVNFGRREAVGVIVAVKHETDVPEDKLKDAGSSSFYPQLKATCPRPPWITRLYGHNRSSSIMEWRTEHH